MKNIALVTDIPFWKIGLGKNARIQELCHFLSRQSQFTLYYLGEGHPPYSGPIFQKHHKQLQLKSCLEKEKHDLVIVQYIHLHWVADFPLKKTAIYLDAHDLLSERTRAFELFNRQSNSITFEQEITYFRKFDKVMFLQNEELEKVVPILGKDRVLLCPHPILPEIDVSVREEVKAISFFGSPSWPNIDGIQWFHDTVIPLLGNLAHKCIVNGTISTSPLLVFSPRLTKGQIFSFLGDYYQNVDIAINPVLYGSGLKIKTVEAIAYGIPLVTTSVGATGIRQEASNSFLLADSPQEFANAITALARSIDLRRQISSRAKIFAKKFFSPEACFASLLK